MLIGSDTLPDATGVNMIRDHVENFKQGTEMIMRTYTLLFSLGKYEPPVECV